MCAQIGDEACWGVYERIVELCPECSELERHLTNGSVIKLHQENTSYLQNILGRVLGGWRPNPLVNWNTYERFDKTLAYMYQEMITNAQSGEAERISTWLQLSCVPQANQYSSNLIAALYTWSVMVRTGGPWDHKWKLDSMLELGKTNDYFFPIRGDLEYEYYYDIWSNIHYGYVGRAIGFDSMTLQYGANLGDYFVGRNDAGDVLNTQIGIDLWDSDRLNLTPQRLHQVILEHKNEYLRIQREENDGTLVLIPWTNGR